MKHEIKINNLVIGNGQPLLYNCRIVCKSCGDICRAIDIIHAAKKPVQIASKFKLIPQIQ